MNELRKYTPTQFLYQLSKTYDGNILDSQGTKMVDSYLSSITREYSHEYVPIIALPEYTVQPTIEKTTKVSRLSNPFLDQHPSWTFRTEYYELSQFKDILCYAFFKTFDPMFPFIPMEQQYEWIREYKFALLNEFKKNNYYQVFSYSPNTDFKKIDLDEIFGMDRPIPLNMIRILCDVFGIYLISISHDGLIHCPSICSNDSSIVWVIVEDYERGWYILRPENREYFLFGDIKDTIRTIIPQTLETAGKYALEDIQKWARLYGVDHKKEGKTGKKNKLKDELIDEIKAVCKSLEK
jgi:hypothetical protein